MAELTAQDIKVWNGSAWVSGFNISDGSTWQNINDGKVNVRGGDGNWYKKNSIIAEQTSSIVGFTTGKYHLDAQSTNWSALRIASNGNYNNDFYSSSFISFGYYMIGRGLLRFDFTGVTPFNFTNVKLELFRDTSNNYYYNEENSLYLFNNNSTPLTTEFSSFGARYSEIAGCTFTNNTMSIELNSVGIAAVQTAINNQNIITFMIRTKADSENIPPTQDIYYPYTIYENSKLIFS